MTAGLRANRLGVRVSWAAIAASWAVIGASATAEEVQRAPNRAPASTSDAVVAPVTVTAERRAVNLQDAPLAATVLSGQQLQERGVYDVDQLQFVSPSLTVTNYGLGEDFNIRGIGKTETNVQTPSGIVVYRDGVATFPGFFTFEPYFDIASIEVLRGPQGTFAGQNASGGAIFVTENDPSLNGASGYVEGQYGTFNDGRVRGWANLPIGDTFAIRLAANAERIDTFYNITGPIAGHPQRLEEASARASFLWTPTTNLKVLLKNDYTWLDAGGLLSSPMPITGGTYASSKGLFDVSNNVQNKSIAWFYRSVLNVSYAFDDGVVLKSITGYQQGRGQSNADIDGTTLEPNSFAVIGKESIGSEELNLISPDTGRLKWVLGAYYQRDIVKIPHTLPGFDIHTPPLDILLGYRTPKTTEAGFGQFTFDLTDALQVVAGARYTHSTFRLDDKTSLLIGGLPPSALGLGFLFPDNEFAHAVQSDDKVTGKIDLNWKLDENNLLYAFIATGHKPGGINTTPVPYSAFTPQVVVPFAPEDLTDYEIGWKPTLAEGHVRLQLDGFYTQYKNFQLSFANNAGTALASGQSIIRNVPGETQIWGLEAQGQAVFGAWSFDASADYLHTRLGSTPGTCATLPNPGPSCLGGPLGPEFVGGNNQPYAPAWSFDFGAQYVAHLSDGSTLSPRIDYAYLSSQWASPFQGKDPLENADVRALEQFAFHLAPINVLNAQLTWRKGEFSATLYGTNLTDEQYFYESGRTTALGPAHFGPGGSAFPTFGVLRVASAPRQFGVRVSKDF